MTQNTSHAVMSQRTEPRDSRDDFPTPPWATRALCKYIIDIRGHSVWDPACGAGHMVRPLRELAGAVTGSDIYDYGKGFQVRDFLGETVGKSKPDWVITNPPFRLAEQFLERGLTVATYGVALLVRSVFIESVGRYRGIFNQHPPSVMAQFAERVPMVRGRLDRKASTATAYCWLVWNKRRSSPTQLMWIPPCRAELERDEDYK